MGLYYKVKQLADNQGKSLQELALELNFSINAFYKWKTQEPKADAIRKIADYFGVSTDYLLGRDSPDIKAETDLSKMLDNATSFDGQPMSDHDREVILAYLEGKFGSK